MHWTVIVTGASRGFGRAVVRMLGRALNDKGITCKFISEAE